MIMKNQFPFFAMLILLMAFAACRQEAPDTFTDSRDGKQYPYVQIGDQVWMAANLRYKPESGAYYAYNDDEAYGEQMGYLYDWQNACEVCPDGWHLPGRDEWDILTSYLGGMEVAGTALKAPDAERWKTEVDENFNSSGFTALPEGVRRYDGRFSYRDRYTYFWSASDGRRSEEAWTYALDGPQKSVFRISWDKNNALSVRCVKNSE
jgi:uncharacterized protein (TIGR02145 family)